MSDSSQPHPPSRPRPSSTGLATSGGGGPLDALGRLQTVAALVLGILLFAVPLYLWRRPRAVPSPRSSDATPYDAAHDGSPPPVVLADAGHPPPLKLADARILECHDKGPSHTAPDQCDHIAAFEKAFADAILASHECVPTDAGVGTLEYVADLSFARKRNPITVTLPHDGRSYASPRIAKDCLTGVKARLRGLPLGTFPHAHARYKVALVASYPGTTPP